MIARRTEAEVHRCYSEIELVLASTMTITRIEGQATRPSYIRISDSPDPGEMIDAVKFRQVTGTFRQALICRSYRVKISEAKEELIASARDPFMVIAARIPGRETDMVFRKNMLHLADCALVY
jgi:hypothetical protein